MRDGRNLELGWKRSEETLWRTVWEMECTELGGEFDICNIEEGVVKRDSLASALQGIQESHSVEWEKIMSFGLVEFEVAFVVFQKKY